MEEVQPEHSEDDQGVAAASQPVAVEPSADVKEDAPPPLATEDALAEDPPAPREEELAEEGIDLLSIPWISKDN